MDRARPRWHELDGLRAIAVVAVIAFHLDLGWAQGGFLGVDVFFVISGFLITTLLIDERDRTGRVSLGGFWSRRARRLAPPAIVMILATLVATYVWLVPERWSSIRDDSVASLAWVANWRFIHQDAGYFAEGLGPSPLEHMWSLAVEEQFYLLWPLVMLGALWLWRRRSAVPVLVLGGAALASAMWMAVLYEPTDIDRAYFGTDARAQQLLVGAALAWAVRRWPSLTSEALQRRARPLVWFAGAGLIVLVVVADGNSAWLYHGGFLVASLAAAVVVLAARSASPAVAPMSWRPLVAIGERSYGLYLWHWPVIVFVGPAIGLALSGLPLLALRLALIVALTEVSHRLIELPTRRTRRAGAAVAGWAAAAVVVGVVAVTVLVPPDGRTLTIAAGVRPQINLPSQRAVEIAPDASSPRAAGLAASSSGGDDGDASSDGAPDRSTTGDPGTASGSTPLPPGPADVPAESASWSPAETGGPEDATLDATVSSQDGGQTPGAGLAPGADAEPTSILVYGDSTAFVLVDNAPEPDDDWVIAGYAEPGCGIVPGSPLAADGSRGIYSPSRCEQWRAGWRSAIEYFDADIAVVMAGAWAVVDHEVDGRRVSSPSPEWEEVVTGAVRDIVGEIDGPTRRIVLLRLPCMESVDDQTTARNDPVRVAAYNAILDVVAAENDHVEVMPLDELLCPGGEPLRQIDGETVRYDGVHLTPAGAAHVWEWLFARLHAD